MQQFLGLLLVFSVVSLSAQDVPKDYFQQQVDYKIDVTLDDQLHRLKGTIEFTYKNNSPDSLAYLLIHLWPNAYKTPQTAFGTQFTENGDRSFYFSKPQERGFIDELHFKENGNTLNWRYYADQPDIARLALSKPLAPGASITISTPFRVQLPKSVSRLGHVDQSYQITQWYPKPAVYDSDGWHPMPYLDQGEFYSEFGSFDVKITLAENYYVGATGVLQTASEWKAINKRIAFSKKQDFTALVLQEQEIPPSAEAKKTLHYTAENVHDFAWFADKRFYILEDEATLPSGKTIPTYVFFTNEEADLWEKGAMYTKRAVEYYSTIVGEYPYPQATAVQSALGAGGGMEYPMVTVIGLSYSPRTLDLVITHEVGHNWFYGILASNERTSAWMDEGFNSYVESRYTDKYYTYNPSTNYLAYMYNARQGEDQASTTSSEKLTNFNYFLVAYAKPTLVFRFLEDYLGTEKMNKILHRYYESWKFKHPSQKAVQQLFEEASGKNLDWVFEDLLGSTKKLNYAITKVQNNEGQVAIRIKNKGEIAAPFPLSVIVSPDSSASHWFPGLAPGKDTTIQLDTEAFRYVLKTQTLDVQKADNKAQGAGLFKTGLWPKPALVFSQKGIDQPSINFAPALGYNSRDGFMPGAAIYNYQLLDQKITYALAPLYSFSAKTVVGMGEFNTHHYPNQGTVHNWSLGVGFKSFHNFDNDNFDYHIRYSRVNPNVKIALRRSSARSAIQHRFEIENPVILEESEIFERQDTVTQFVGKETFWRSTHRLRHIFENEQPVAPFHIITQLEYANYYESGPEQRQHYLKLSVEGNFKIYYADDWAVDIRGFAAGFPIHTDRAFGDFPLQLAARSGQDYHYDHHLFGRREQDNFGNQQIILREGGFKTPISNAQSSADGRSNSFIVAINVKSNIPIKLPFSIPLTYLKPYVDMGYYQNTAPAVTIQSPSEQIFLNGGLMLDIWDGFAGIYLPLVGSSNVMTLLKQQQVVPGQAGKRNFFKTIAFSIDLSRLHPKKVVKEVMASF